VENVEEFNYLDSMRVAMEKAAFNRKKTLFASKLVTCYIWSIALYGAETWTLWKLDQKYLESFEMWCWRRMDRVHNEAVLHRVKKERNILHTTRREGRPTGLGTYCVGTAF
jgi:hypothetical protein